MFPYTNTDNNLESLFKKQYFHQLYDQIQNPISEAPFFSNFPSPFFDEHQLPLNQIFQTDERTSDNTKKESPKHQPIKPMRRRNLVAAPRKRTGKKDRHSKICTAQGIRDRRMRLSLPIARKFFDLQDMLGYDKASKTIEWLFNQSKRAIKDLSEDIADGKSESDCEVVSGIEENSNNNEIDGGEERQEKNEKSEKKHRRTANTRESREKARERARCRTEEKMMGKSIEYPKLVCKSSPNRISPNFEKLGLSSSSPFDRDEQEIIPAYDASDYNPLLHQPSDVGTIEKLLGNSSSSASNFATSCCIDPSFMEFHGNWDNLQSNERLNYAVTKIEASMPGNPNSIYSATTSDFPFFHQ